MREGASDDALREVISSSVKKKLFSHLGAEEISAGKNRPMITIGG